MIIKPQDNIRALLRDVEIPKMLRIKQKFENRFIENVAEHLNARLYTPSIQERITPGMRVVLTGGSREISNMSLILREVATFIKLQGAIPYIIPAMGSHGGSIAENQREILEGFGITEEYCGCAIYSSMDTVIIGHTDEGVPVHIDRFAAGCDAIIPINRIKAHTAFRGSYESGLYKMLGIGLGKQKGADAIHSAGFGVFKERIPAYAHVVIEKHNVPFGVAIVENAYDQTCIAEVILGEEIGAREPVLLDYAKSCMPRIMFPETDVLIVREIGKNYSGSGMDPNVTGTWTTPYASGGIKKQKTVVLDLTDKSHGNAMGLGKADVTTMRVFNKIDFTATYPNVITSTVIEPSKIAMVLEDDKMAIQAAIKTCTGVTPETIRVVMIKNTLQLDEIYISTSMLSEAVEMAEVELLEKPHELHFDSLGNLLEFL